MEGLLVFMLLMIIISSSHGSDDTVAYEIFGERFAYECSNGLNVSYGDAESGGFFAEVRFIFPRPNPTIDEKRRSCFRHAHSENFLLLVASCWFRRVKQILILKK